MPQIVDCTLHYLVIDRQPERTIHVFLGDNAGLDGSCGPEAAPVVLEQLPNALRFSNHGGQPVVGRAPRSQTWFHEFASEEERDLAGFVAVPHFRVCDTWEDYHFPWGRPTSDQETERACDDSL